MMKETYHFYNPSTVEETRLSIKSIVSNAPLVNGRRFIGFDSESLPGFREPHPTTVQFFNGKEGCIVFLEKLTGPLRSVDMAFSALRKHVVLMGVGVDEDLDFCPGLRRFPCQTFDPSLVASFRGQPTSLDALSRSIGRRGKGGKGNTYAMRDAVESFVLGMAMLGGSIREYPADYTLPVIDLTPAPVRVEAGRLVALSSSTIDEVYRVLANCRTPKQGWIQASKIAHAAAAGPAENQAAPGALNYVGKTHKPVHQSRIVTLDDLSKPKPEPPDEQALPPWQPEGLDEEDSETSEDY